MTSSRIFHKRAELSGDDALAAALTSGNQMTRIMARGAAASWMPDFARWINDQINRPKADHPAFLQALARLQLQTLASIAAQLINVDSDRGFVTLYLEMAEDELVKHMARTRAEAAEDWS